MHYLGSSVCNSWVNARSFLQLYNPPGSGVTLSVDCIRLAHGNTSADGFDLRRTKPTLLKPTGAYGTFGRYGMNKQLDLADSEAELRWGNCPIGDLPPDSEILDENWTGLQFDDHTYNYNPPILVPEGYGILAGTARDNVTIIAVFEWSEIPVVSP